MPRRRKSSFPSRKPFPSHASVTATIDAPPSRSRRARVVYRGHAATVTASIASLVSRRRDR